MKATILFTTLILLTAGCKQKPSDQPSGSIAGNEGKIVIYQVFTRLFGNTNSTNKPWGTIEENGVGKFNDFTDTSLQSIRNLGVTHIWYTGVPHHAVIRDYSTVGISADDPDVVKGRAGSPYAVKDYYNVNPDLAVDPAKRLDEFKALIERTHKNGLKLIIDIVPNHVARHYVSLSKPDSVRDFGADDDISKEYHRENNFYYLPNDSFRVPVAVGYKPLGGASHPLSDGKFHEQPAKWTGNGSRLAQPKQDDWYETVKINYGIRPDGSKDFDTLPATYANLGIDDHHQFWKNKSVPSSWKKFRDIALYWLNMGVDGFRFDMAEMVPVEFWSYLNSSIKTSYPEALLLAEVYNPGLYRPYIQLGKMDYLYDKVEFYDTLKHIIQGHGSADNLAAIQKGMADIEHHMLHFLENHDEQRIASPAFAGNPEKAKPAMVVSALISTSPTLVYFGQELGEPGAETGGFGQPTRTSIFDYVGVPHHQRWMNKGKFDGGQSSKQEKKLRSFYQELLQFTISQPVLKGNYAAIQYHNRQHTSGYHDKLFAFSRWDMDTKLIVLSNFSNQPYQGKLVIPADLVQKWALKDGTYSMNQVLFGKNQMSHTVSKGEGSINVQVPAYESLVLKLEK
ncbi:alpha-amylase family protein [Flavihumibacter cheonanensis]|uniref:alpha-amylase family glycosyl hydrolase n=1 Tax=Flavihumibacter cheonanensis TaxID=1442385 RepID=UPI001EF8266F|nr:alpha-amylase family glycosyl hydrolase [Flavihumibacter cheonanensis]MCG7751252.1 alpha-amylase family protein [Flavihumibacter cheonanensis]